MGISIQTENRKYNFYKQSRNNRFVPKTIKIPEISEEEVVNLAVDTIGRKKQALVFVATKSSAEATADKIAAKIKDNIDVELSEKLLHALPRPTKQCQRLARNAKKGVVFHHSGLHHHQRELIEDKFRDGTIKIICCTPTLAAGLDLPAFRAILKDLKRYNGRWGTSWIPVLEYQQMCGRAGRPGKEDFGEAIIIASTEADKEEIYEKYVIGDVEPIYSKLAVEPVLRTYVLSLIATEVVNSRQKLIDFFKKTFWAQQYKDMEKLEKIMMKMANLLEEFDFIAISSKKSDFRAASDIEDDRIISTPIGKRVAELYIDPITAHNIILGLKKAGNKPSAFALLQLISNQLELRPKLAVRKNDYETVSEKLLQEELLANEPAIYDPEYGDFLDSVKTAMFLEEWISEKTEEEILEKFNVRPGEIKTKIDSADWLLYAMEELARMIQRQELLKEIAKLRLRVKHGIKEDILQLMQLKGIGRVKARKLFANKIKALEDVRQASFGALAQVIGAKTAASVKEQLGEKIEAVPEKKRKGQLSLLGYKD